jgi:DNA-binding MarR family transcriptional regulator
MVAHNNYLRTSCNPAQRSPHGEGAKEVAVMVDDTPAMATDEPTVAALATGEAGQCDDADELAVAVGELLSELTGFIRQMKRGIGRMSATTRRDGIEYAAFGLLAHLVTEGPKRTTALAESVYADPSTVSRQTAALVRNGLLERQPDPEDGRASILAATPDGERVFHEHRKEHCLRMADILAHWRVADVRRLTNLLTRLNRDTNAYCQEAGYDHPDSVIELRGRRP